MKLYHKNPRQITKQQYQDLEAWLEELGDLSGIVHDLNSDEVVAGNQRSRIFGIILDQGSVVITEQLDKPTSQGTVARGYVEWRGEQFSYRRVRWTPEQCEKANIIANKAGGGFDYDILANEFDLNSLLEWGFSQSELFGIVVDLGEDAIDGFASSKQFDNGVKFVISTEQDVLNDVKAQLIAICKEHNLDYKIATA